MQPKEHMDYILKLIDKMVGNPSINLHEKFPSPAVVPPVEKPPMITPEEINRRINERLQKK